MLSDVYENADDFDVIHNHIDYWSFGFARLVNTPTVSTMHGRLDLEDLMPVYARYKTVPLVSISDAQRPPLPFMNWVSTVYHGLPRDLLTFSKGPGKYLAFLGRISPEKRPDLAIDVARKAGIPINLRPRSTSSTGLTSSRSSSRASRHPTSSTSARLTNRKRMNSSAARWP
jgi:glycosyltransferase involved in cell wall biosynthesis